MVRKPPYSFKRLVNVYKVRLNVYKIKRYAHRYLLIAGSQRRALVVVSRVAVT